ncbi:MAG: Eco57I restriction-modification methylase domain-containing protein [bacterium]
MSLFQHSVLNKYLKEANQDEMKSAYEKLKEYFHNPIIQQNIRESKEEQFQEGFLTELFVKVLGYTINPNPDYNLTTEFKNERGARKADGAILKDGAAIGVIELKSTKTKELEAIRLQAFDYKANQSKCVYVITSNFEKVRFYINNAVDFEEFDLFRLKYEHFQLMWLCLAKENLLKGIPLAIKEASLLKEEKITKQIYVDYSLFKSELYNDLVTNNLNLDIFNGKEEKEIKLTLFKKSQKLLDRFLFIFFGEDRGLLPPNSISDILKKWEKLEKLDEYRPLYERYKKYFNYLNIGRKEEDYEIFAYNGGLFAPDEVLDNIIIGDEVLYKHTKVLTGYDFETEVDVNILGHIFENSLNEIEEKTAQIEGESVDLKKSKRKKDGVFYTPKYITKYIVENTVGKLCEEKRNELEIKEYEYLKSRKGRTTKKLIELDDKLDIYREWLLTLTICDPACGSGAFLNQALDFLIREHHFIDELRAKLLDVPMVFTEVENSILENNIYGVDINEESVEIAKLSLWLRTAQKGRKLTTLSSNIKCGNSLIDDPEIAGEKAFNWHDEFPEVFKNGGFDVVIGNPPYVNIVNIEDKNYRKTLQKEFSTFKNKCDLYSLFIEKSIYLSRTNAELGFIFPNSWMGTSSFLPFRKYISEKTKIQSLVELPPGVFDDAVVTTVIMIMCKAKATVNHEIELFYPVNQIIQKRNNTIKLSNVLKTEHFAFSFNQNIELKSNGQKLNDIAYFSLGIKTSNDKRFVFDHKIDENSFPMLRGKYIGRYFLQFGGDYLWYMPELIKEKAGGRPRVLEHFLRPKILIQDVAKNINATYDDSNYLVNDTINVIYDTDENIPLFFILGLINSKTVNKWFNTTFPEGLHIKINQLQEIPLPVSNEQQRNFISKMVENLLNINKQFSNFQAVFIKYVSSQIDEIVFTNKLQNWHELDFSEFISEINKAIKKAGGQKLSKMDEMEWMEVFEAKKAEAQNLKSEIEKTDREIDQMVYELYALTDEEIKIVEEST